MRPTLYSVMASDVFQASGSALCRRSVHSVTQDSFFAFLLPSEPNSRAAHRNKIANSRNAVTV
jgi:hypothetical protein